MQPQRKLLPARYRRPVGSRLQQRMVNETRNERMWPGTTMAFGVIIWLFAFWFLGSRTLITYNELFRWFALFAFAGNLVPYRFSGKKLGMERGEWFFFNLLAIGPFLFTLALGINMLFHSPEQLLVVPNATRLDPHRYWIDNDRLPPMTPVGNRSELDVQPGDHLIGIADGSLGYQVIITWTEIESDQD